MTERFKLAYDALIEAFYNGTLAKGNCAACACGNIIAKAVGVIVTKKHMLAWRDPEDYPSIDISFTNWENRRTFFRSCDIVAHEHWRGIVNEAGYTTEEFTQIEGAFESNTKISWMMYGIRSEQEILEDQYNGLCAVFEVLMKLDGIEENDYKQKLQQKPGLILEKV